jgi:hypothetical protein
MDRLRAYETVGHVLGVLAEMHEQIARVLGELGGQACDERRKLNLDYLSGHHARRAAALAAYQEDAEAPMLDQWFQIPFPEEPRDLLASLQTQGLEQTSIDELVVRIDAFMDRLLPHLRDRAETRNAKELFQGLLDIEERDRHLRSRALASFEQI